MTFSVDSIRAVSTAFRPLAIIWPIDANSCSSRLSRASSLSA
ncbi:hypothetical protein ACFQH2_14625 [Natronoarchaeum sp. GCM10025703]